MVRLRALVFLVTAGIVGSACGSDPTDFDALGSDAADAQVVVQGEVDAAPPLAPNYDPTLKGPDCDGLRPFSYLGKAPDQIRTSDLMAGEHSTFLQPAASKAWDALVAAAVAAGIPVKTLYATGWGSRPASNQSVHPIGLAVDVNWLADPARSNKFREVAGEPLPISDAFYTETFQWLYANSWKFGWCTTRNNRPLYLNGTATGGRRTDGSFYGLEAWHFEFIPGAGGDPAHLRTKTAGDRSGPFGVAD